jgi:hypothetical protein
MAIWAPLLHAVGRGIRSRRPSSSCRGDQRDALTKPQYARSRIHGHVVFTPPGIAGKAARSAAILWVSGTLGDPRQSAPPQRPQQGLGLSPGAGQRVQAATDGPSGGAADSLDEAKAAFLGDVMDRWPQRVDRPSVARR